MWSAVASKAGSVTNFASHVDLADEAMPSLAMLSHGKHVKPQS